LHLSFFCCPFLRPPRNFQSAEADAEAEFELDSEVDSSSHHSHSLSHAHSHAHKQPFYQYPSTAISSHSYLDTLASPVVIRGAAGTGLSPLNIDAWRYATTPQLNMIAAAGTSTTVLPQFELRSQLVNNEAEVYFLLLFVVVFVCCLVKLRNGIAREKFVFGSILYVRTLP
jgi:hypothetical protein